MEQISIFMQEHWMSVLMASYLIGMMLYGHFRGFLRLSVSLFAVVVSLLVVRAGMPYMTGYLKDNTGIHKAVEDMMEKAVGLDQFESVNALSGSGSTDASETANAASAPASSLLSAGLADTPAAQRLLIEGLKLPESMKQTLVENNNTEIYQLLGVGNFVDYIGAYLADRIINTVSFLLLFFLVYIGMRILVYWLDLVAKLPVISGINQIAGAVLGLCQALVYFWVFGLMMNLFVSTGWGQYILTSMESAPWVSWLYHHNLLTQLLVSTIWNIL